MTSLKDDTIAGQTGTSTQSPTADWRGLKIESSATPAAANLNTLTIKYAGANAGAALDLRKNPYTFGAPNITNSITGIRLTSTTATFTNLSLTANQTGMESDGNSPVIISTSEIKANTLFGINNKTPATIQQV